MALDLGTIWQLCRAKNDIENIRMEIQKIKDNADYAAAPMCKLQVLLPYKITLLSNHYKVFDWFCQYHLTHFIRTRIMQRERYDHSRAFFGLPEADHRWRCRFFCLPSNSYNISRS